MSRRGGKRHAKRVERSAVPGARWVVAPRGVRYLLDGSESSNADTCLGSVRPPLARPHRIAAGVVWRVLCRRKAFGAWPALTSFDFFVPNRRAGMRLLETFANDPSLCARIQHRFDETGEIFP